MIGWDCGRDVGMWREVIGLNSEESLEPSRLERAAGQSGGYFQEVPGVLQGYLLHLEGVEWS